MYSTLASSAAILPAAAVFASVLLAGVGYFTGPPPPPKKRVKPNNEGQPSMDPGGEASADAADVSEEGQVAALRNLPPEEKEQFRPMFTQVIQQARALLTQGKLEEAREIVSRIKKFGEQIFGKDSKEYSSATFFLGSIHESMGNNDEAKQLYVESFYFFNNIKEIETAAAISNAILRNVKILKGDVIQMGSIEEVKKYYSEVANWSEIATQLSKKLPNMDKSVISEKILSTALDLSNLGSFKKAEELFTEALQLVKPSESVPRFWEIVNIYAACLLQQRKNQQAFTLIAQARKTIEQILSSSSSYSSAAAPPSVNLSPMNMLEEIQSTIVNLVVRLAEISFQDEKFQDCEDYLSEATQLSVKYGLQVPPKIVNDLACVAFELNDETTAKEFFRDIKSMPQNSQNPTPVKSHSKFLSTVSTAVDNDKNETIANGVKFYISLSANQQPANRKEGDPLIPRPRKLPANFFVEVHFENTISKETPITVPFEANIPDFTVESPVMEFPQKKYYKVDVDIFTDKTKAKKLGSHHQLLYVSPGLALRRQRLQQQQQQQQQLQNFQKNLPKQ